MQLNPSIFKAYDVRGTYPDELNEETARAIGVGFAAYLKPTRIAVGRDMRLSSPAIAATRASGRCHCADRTCSRSCSSSAAALNF